MGPFCRTLTSTALITIGAVFFSLGLVVKFSLFPALLEAQVYENLKIEEGTEGWDAFVEPPVPVYMKFRFFTVTNPDEVTKNGAKPNLTEVGPYAYKEVRRKEDIFAVDNDKIQFGQYYEYHFDKAETDASECVNSKGFKNCTAEDEIKVLNGALMAVVGLLQQYKITGATTIGDIIDNFGINLADLGLDIDDATLGVLKSFTVGQLLLDPVNDLFNGADESYVEEIFVATTVDGILYSGFRSTILHALGKVVETTLAVLQSFLPDLITDDLLITEDQICTQLLPQLSEQVSNCEFGIFKGQNATKENSYYTINNGRNVKGKFNAYEKFNGQTSLPENWWKRIGPTPAANKSGITGVCHDIYGTDGAQYPPFVVKDETKWVFVSQLCRSIWLDFDEEVDVRGIEAYRYRPPFSVYDMRSPDNYCYCPEINDCATPNATEGVDAWNVTECYQYCRDGFLRVGDCYGGIPIIMTAPHFWNADKDLVTQMNGVKPDRELHDTFLDIEPITGVALSAHKRIQINFPMRPYADLDLTSKLPIVDVFPVLWADEGADLDETNANKFKDAVLKPTQLVNGLSIGLGVVVGALLFMIGVFIIAKSQNCDK